MKRALLTVIALVLAAGLAARLLITPPEKTSEPATTEQATQQEDKPLMLQARDRFLGIDCAKNEETGAALTRQAAESGDMQAIGLMGILYLGGIGVPQDFNEALKWLARSTEKDGRDLHAHMQAFMSALEKLPPEEKQKQLEAAKAAAQKDMREVFMRTLEKNATEKKGE